MCFCVTSFRNPSDVTCFVNTVVGVVCLTLWCVEGDHKWLQHDADWCGRGSGFRGPPKWPKLSL